MRIGSLRLRLFGLLVVLGVVAGSAVGVATYFSVRTEADALFDYHLRQMALSLRDQGRIADPEGAGLENPEFDYVVQVWSADGVALYSSQRRDRVVPLPPRTVIGFSDVRVNEETWRVFGAATPFRIVQVAQPLAVRRRLAATAAGRSVLPVVVAVPLVGLALWWLVGVSLAPLRRVVGAVRARDAGSLAPLPVAGLPSEVEPLVSSFNGLLARLSTAFDAQKAFVADAAHELRTPLTALKLQVGVLRDAPEGPARAQALDRLNEGVDRAAHLVDQLLTLARAEPGPSLDAVAVDLAQIVRSTITELAPLAESRRASVVFDPSAACRVLGDPSALRGLVRNLIDNALKHAGDAPQIRVSLSSDGDGAALRVDDSGSGIPVEDRDRVFDRFHRREDAGGEGSGLGLAIVRTIARTHGARVDLAESPLGGLRVEVRFPSPDRAGVERASADLHGAGSRRP